jgi:hypothetical protein
MKSDILYNKFNRGELDPLALSRTEIDRVNNSASLMDNWLPMRLGPMMYRPGFEFQDNIGVAPVSTKFNLVPFFKTISERAFFILSDTDIQLYYIDSNDAAVRVRSNNTDASYTNELFDSDIASWTDESPSGTSALWSSNHGGSIKLTGNGASSASIYQFLTVAPADVGEETTYRIVIKEAPVRVRFGSTIADRGGYFDEVLNPGIHFLTFTLAAGSRYVTFSSSSKYDAYVASIVNLGDSDIVFSFGSSVDSFDDLQGLDVEDLEYDQSGDIVFFASSSVPRFQIERRGDKSWSLVLTRSDDGPFGNVNDTAITMSVDSLDGMATLTASESYFSNDSEDSSQGDLIRITSSAQNRTEALTAVDTGTDPIDVQGDGAARAFTYEISGTFTATIQLQRSADQVVWTSVAEHTGTVSTTTFNDEIDGAEYFYRIQCTSYTSGTANVVINYKNGTTKGVGRIVDYTSPTQVTLQVLKPFGEINEATTEWELSEWGTGRYPSAVQFYEGRLCYAGNLKFWASASDAYYTFDDTIEGDSKPIRRTIGFGSSKKVNWLRRGKGLLMGMPADEILVRSNSFGDVLTNTNVNLRQAGTQGTTNISPVQIDGETIYVHRDNKRIFSIESNDVESQVPEDITYLNPSILSNQVKQIAILRQPETRVVVLDRSGELRVYLLDRSEDVFGWSRITTDGSIKAIAVIPSEDEDRLFILRESASYGTLERMAKLSEVSSGKCFDSFIDFTGNSNQTIDIDENVDLRNRTLGVWADNQYRGEFTSNAAGEVDLGAVYSDIIIGIPYTANYTSNKLSAYKDINTVNERRRVVNIGITAREMWPTAVTMGPDTSNLLSLPLIEGGTDISQTALITEYDEPMWAFNGNSETDSRVHIRAIAPVTLMSYTVEIEADDYPNNKG